MTVLEELATATDGRVADMITARRESAPAPEEPDRTLAGWDNRPSWDNWKQKPKPFKKKRIYFRDR